MIKRTMCCLCLSLVLGILYGKNHEWYFVMLFLLFLIIVAMAVYHLANSAGKVLFVRLVLCIVFFCAGVVHMHTEQDVRNGLKEVLSDGDTIVVRGKVLRKEEPSIQSYSSRNEDEVIQTQTFQKKQFTYYLTDTQVILDSGVYPCYGILIYCSNGQYRPGNVLSVTGKYAPFSISRNEGNFNEMQYRQSRKWEFRVYADFENLLSQYENKYMICLEALRDKMQGVFADALNTADAGVMTDMVLGEKSLLEPEIKDLYRDAGISHILAISGLHVSILGMGVLSLLQRLGVHRKWSACFAAVFVCNFGVFSGMEVSTMRAVGMFLLMMAALVLGLSYDSLSALSFSAAVQIWGNPFLLEYAGFLFSYSAVFGVVVIWKLLQRAKKEKERGKKVQTEKGGRGIWQRSKRKVWETMCVSACIQFATLPLSLWFYYEIPLYSVLVNACILPFMGILLFLGVLGGGVGTIFPNLGALILKPAGWLLAFNETICRMAGKLPWAHFIVGKPSIMFALAYYGILCFCLYFIWRKKNNCYLIGIVMAVVCLLSVRGTPRFEVDVLDVGQGDGIFIQNGSGEHFFIDGGSSDVNGVGKYRILPFLKSHGIRAIKGWIVSHADADHISGLLEIFKQGYPVENLILAGHTARDEAMENLLLEAKKAGCEILYVLPGMKFGSGDVVFTALAPDESGLDRNESSLVVLLEYLDFKALFTGDIGAAQEQKLIETDTLVRYHAVDVDFYKAAHHGSNHSNSQEFLEAVSPNMTVISCAEKNSYGHPGREALEHIQEAGSYIFLTMEHGQITVLPKKEGVRVWTFLP